MVLNIAHIMTSAMLRFLRCTPFTSFTEIHPIWGILGFYATQSWYPKHALYLLVYNIVYHFLFKHELLLDIWYTGDGSEIRRLPDDM